MGKLLNNTKRLQIPRLINTDKAPTYGRALALLKREGKCPQHVHHRQIQYRNNIIECDHGKLKRIINATLGFKSMKTAYATIKGIEVMRAIRKGQAESFYFGHPLGEMRLVSRVFEKDLSITRKASSSITLQQCHVYHLDRLDPTTGTGLLLAPENPKQATAKQVVHSCQRKLTS